MRKYIFIAFMGIVVACSSAGDIVFTPCAETNASGKPEFVPGSVLVQFRCKQDIKMTIQQRARVNRAGAMVVPKVTVLEMDAGLIDQEGTSRQDSPDRGELVLAEYGDLSPEETLAVIRELSNETNVVYAEPDYYYDYYYIPNELTQMGHALTNLHIIRAPQAWDVTTGASSVVVGVIDDGVDYTHPDLRNNIVQGYDFGSNDWDPMPCEGDSHGTHIAGIIAAQGNNLLGSVGVAWNARVMPLRKGKAGEDSRVTASKFSQCVTHAIKNGIKIINCSWGSKNASQTMYNTIKLGMVYNVLFVIAAGNKTVGDTERQYPASHGLDNIISVAWSENNDELSPHSCFGIPHVDIAAPGQWIYSTVRNGLYDYKRGTSMAAPQVAGAAALVKSLHPDWSFRQIKAAILDNADRVPALQGRVVSGGRLNLFHALVPVIGHDAINQSHVGQFFRVEGVITNTYNTGEICFLDFPVGSNRFVGIVWPENYALFGGSPELFFRNKRVRISGRIAQYGSKFEIIIRNRDQVEILD
ncbi:MAG TPA: S8 family serine peptidase [Spirochaetota bacterium]|nr:S8 family serine peptidase [Spirochaetota bacterium]